MSNINEENTSRWRVVGLVCCKDILPAGLTVVGVIIVDILIILGVVGAFVGLQLLAYLFLEGNGMAPTNKFLLVFWISITTLLFLGAIAIIGMILTYMGYECYRCFRPCYDERKRQTSNHPQV